MKLDLKKLEKATKIYEQIKILDAQIIEIDRFAMLGKRHSANALTLSANATSLMLIEI
jgi:hypothetical protein